MLYIRSYVAPSIIDGIGLFAGQTIRKGELIWKFQYGFDLMIPKNLVVSESTDCSKDVLETTVNFPSCVKFDIIKYGYTCKSTGMIIYPVDHAKFINHSKKPNMSCKLIKGPGGQKVEINVAKRNIEFDEELTLDYREFDDDVNEKWLLDIEKGINHA